MATLQPRGASWRIQFEDRDGRRRSLSLGKVPKRTATATKLRVEQLVAAQLANTAPDAETTRWLATAGEKLIERLSKVGLVAARQNVSLGSLVDDFLDAREADPRFKPATVASYRAAFKHLREYFGDSKPVRAITKGAAREWRDDIAKDRAENTVRKWTAKVKTLINDAVERELLDRNPFDGLPASTIAVRSRDYFISREEADKVLKACPSLEWRLIFALARYGGLRCPTEVLALRWGDILWDQKRFIVRSIKTEHHEGHEMRITPLFPELEPLLSEAFDAAADGAEFVIERTRDTSTNLRTTMAKIIARAGLKPWPKLFQNLRATRATELADRFPGHVAAAWLGHSEKVARGHYWQVTDDHFEAATNGANMVQKASADDCTEPKPLSEESVNAVVCDALRLLSTRSVAGGGLEPPWGLPPGGF